MSKKAKALHPEFPVSWTTADAERADREGWNVYQAHGGLEIERNDVSDVEGARHFESDEDAIEHVFQCSLQGSELHARALLIHVKYMDDIWAAAPGSPA